MSPMALALGWGILLATPLTLVLISCCYVIGQDIHLLFRKDTWKDFLIGLKNARRVNP